jgi:hypothetical protein
MGRKGVEEEWEKFIIIFDVYKLRIFAFTSSFSTIHFAVMKFCAP